METRGIKYHTKYCHTVQAFAAVQRLQIRYNIFIHIAHIFGTLKTSIYLQLITDSSKAAIIPLWLQELNCGEIDLDDESVIIQFGLA